MHSHFLGSPFGLLLAGLTHQEIEPSSLRVGFDLLVPSLPVLFRQPPEKLGLRKSRQLDSGRRRTMQIGFHGTREVVLVRQFSEHAAGNLCGARAVHRGSAAQQHRNG